MIYHTIICTFILHITVVYFERLLSCKQHFLMKVFSRGKNKGPKSEVPETFSELPTEKYKKR